MALAGTGLSTAADHLAPSVGSWPERNDGRLANVDPAPDATEPVDGRVSVIVETRLPVAQLPLAALGIVPTWTFEIVPGFAAALAPAQVDLLTGQPWVERISPDPAVKALMDNSVKDIEATRAWTSGYDGRGVTVAVIDTGIDRTDSAFKGAIVGCVALMAGVAVPECDDTDGHGTHVAGTVASRHSTYRGVAPGASLVAVRVLHAAGAGSGSDVIAGIDWVAKHRNDFWPPIKVATMSIGYANPRCGDGRDATARAADALVKLGVSFTVAAGNSGHQKCTVDGASAAFNVVTVGAADDRNTASPFDDRLATFSSAGPTNDGRLKPELVAPGVNIQGVYVGPLIAELDGTSMATPHVAGVLALLLQKEPTLTPALAKARLVEGALRPTAAPVLPHEDWGHGLLNACRTLSLADCQAAS